MVPATFEGRVGAAIERMEAKVGPEIARQLRALVEPTALEIMAGVIVLWLGSHAFGVGEAVDLIIAVVGFVALGWSIFDGLDELIAFAKGSYSARTDTDLDAAATHLARAIGILGVQAVLALLMHGRSPTFAASACHRVRRRRERRVYATAQTPWAPWRRRPAMAQQRSGET